MYTSIDVRSAVFLELVRVDAAVLIYVEACWMGHIMSPLRYCNGEVRGVTIAKVRIVLTTTLSNNFRGTILRRFAGKLCNHELSRDGVAR